MFLTVEQQEFVLQFADDAAPRSPSATLNINHENGQAWLEVILPGKGEEWDKREERLRVRVQEYLGNEYETEIQEAIQDMDGRFVTNIEIRKLRRA